MTFPIQLFFQTATESYSIHCTANDNSFTILTIFNSYLKRNQETIKVLLRK